MNRYRARKILKKYGKAAYRSRIKYVDSMLPENASLIGRISWRRMMKRCVMTALIMILTLTLLLATASAFGIHILDFSFFEKEDHTEIVGNSKPEKEKQEAVFYEPGYIPEGYMLILCESPTKDEKDYIYENKQEDILYISQDLVYNVSLNINNEDCEIREKIIDDIQIKVYDYEHYMIYLFQYYDTFITIMGVLPEQELDKIVTGFDFQ